MLQHRLLSLARMQSFQTKRLASITGSAVTRREFSKASHESGLLEYEFDYLGFDHKVNKGNWPHPYASYMKVLGRDYDLRSELHTTNKASMDEYNRELFDIVEQTMYLP